MQIKCSIEGWGGRSENDGIEYRRVGKGEGPGEGGRGCGEGKQERGDGKEGRGWERKRKNKVTRGKDRVEMIGSR